MCEVANSATRYTAASAIRCNFGMRGFGAYIGIVGMIEANPNRKIKFDLSAICWELHEEKDYVRPIVEDFGLFVVEDGYLIDAFERTPEAKERERQEQARIRRSEAAKKAAATRKLRAAAKAEQSETPLFFASELQTEPTPTQAETNAETTEIEDAFAERLNKEYEGYVQKSTVRDESAMAEYDDGYTGGLPRSEYHESRDPVVQANKPDVESRNKMLDHFDVIRDYWNEIFKRSNRPGRSYHGDPDYQMEGFLYKTFAQYTDEQIKKAFDYAAKQDFVWQLRFAVKPTNIQKLLSEAEQEVYKKVNSLSIGQRELMQRAKEDGLLKGTEDEDIEWLPPEHIQRQQELEQEILSDEEAAKKDWMAELLAKNQQKQR